MDILCQHMGDSKILGSVATQLPSGYGLLEQYQGSTVGWVHHFSILLLDAVLLSLQRKVVSAALAAVKK